MGGAIGLGEFGVEVVAAEGGDGGLPVGGLGVAGGGEVVEGEAVEAGEGAGVGAGAEGVGGIVFMDGEALGREIKGDAAIAGTHLIMLTSVGLRGDAARAREIGFAAFLTKPAKQSELLNCIHEVMGWQPAEVRAAAAAERFVTRHVLREAGKTPDEVRGMAEFRA